MKKENKKDYSVFAQTTETWKVSKFGYNENGEPINSDFNNRTYLKKAYKAYLKGKIFFNYKGNTYPVPRMNKSDIEKLLSEDLLETIDNQINEEE